MDQVLSEFHPALSTWFTRRFAAGPTRPQAQGWPVIRRGHDTLIAAPTGSGKTLSAFLVCIDRLYREAQTRSPRSGLVRVVYVSPLKALTVDIEHNLGRPLHEIAAVARELGFEVPVLRTRVRSGDSAAKDRAAIVREPPEFLITTPESLYLMLTAERSRGLFTEVETVIVDEIHALARDKRGSHLALSLERLDRLGHKRPQRIGLSATQRPLSKVAELLVGYEAGQPRACEIVDTGHQRELELALVLPDRELEAVASAAHMQEVVSKLCGAIEQRRTTLVFVNTRRLAERLAHNLAERLGSDSVAAHHGSLSKERRQRVEQRLREGSLRALVATASLELGIDVGDVELVCQVGSPRSIATFLQRVGRSGHTRFGKPVGQLYPLTRDELLECSALLRAVSHGELDCLNIPEAPLDILAQQVVAECAAAEHTERELFDWIRRASPFARVSEADFERVLQLMSEGIDTGRGRRAAFLHRDRVQGRVSARRGARLAALTSGGAIPENADYRVIADPDETFVGTINEDFALESAAGDVFLLGSTSWRVRRVERGVVRVTDAQGSAPTLPFWLGEAPGRTHELSQQVSGLRRLAQQALVRGGEEALQRELTGWPGLAAAACGEITRYLGAGYRALGVLPNDRDLVFERFFDDTGGMQVVVHAPLGARINRALGLLLRKRFCRSFDFELQAAASDDAIVLSLGPQHSFPLEDMLDYLQPRGVREALTKAVLQIPMFQVRWRWNLNRALVVLRFRGGRRVAPMIQRMESDDVTAAVFPALSACQDNGPIALEPPDHVLVQQTLHDCLTEALDIDGLERVLEQISTGEIRVHFRETTEPSPLSHEILSARPYTFLDDAPLEERRTRAVSVPRRLHGDAPRGPGELDPAAVARVEAEVRPEPRTADELHDLLSGLGVTSPLESFRSSFEELVRAGRAFHVEFDAHVRWGTTESREELEVVFPHASFEPDYRLPQTPGRDPLSTGDAELVLTRWLRGHLECRGPTTSDALSTALGLSPSRIEAALRRLELEGFVMRCRSESSASPTQYVARRLLARIHAYTVQRLRREIEPVSQRDFMRFLLEWQHVTPGSRRRGREAVLRAIDQLQGFEAAAGAWESELLPARIADYDPKWLDELCWSGELVWGRLAPARPARDEAQPRGQVTRSSLITLLRRADLEWQLAAARGSSVPREPATPEAARILDELSRRGALFSTELVQASGYTRRDVEDALWEGVALGRLTCDGFHAVRALIGASPEAHATVSAPRLPIGFRRPGSSLPRGDGRWALLPEPSASLDADELAEAMAGQLLQRWGVLTIELIRQETTSLTIRDLISALRRLEARGLVRGGRFVSGFSGEQYALPEALELLRGVRKQALAEIEVRLSACDPLNLVGVIVPGPRVPRLRGNWVLYRDGLPLEDRAGHPVENGGVATGKRREYEL